MYRDFRHSIPGLIASIFMPDWNVLPFVGWLAIAAPAPRGSACDSILVPRHFLRCADRGALFGHGFTSSLGLITGIHIPQIGTCDRCGAGGSRSATVWAWARHKPPLNLDVRGKLTKQSKPARCHSNSATKGLAFITIAVFVIFVPAFCVFQIDRTKRSALFPCTGSGIRRESSQGSCSLWSAFAFLVDRVAMCGQDLPVFL